MDDGDSREQILVEMADHSQNQLFNKNVFRDLLCQLFCGP